MLPFSLGTSKLLTRMRSEHRLLWSLDWRFSREFTLQAKRAQSLCVYVTSTRRFLYRLSMYRKSGFAIAAMDLCAECAVCASLCFSHWRITVCHKMPSPPELTKSNISIIKIYLAFTSLLWMSQEARVKMRWRHKSVSLLVCDLTYRLAHVLLHTSRQLSAGMERRSVIWKQEPK